MSSTTAIGQADVDHGRAAPAGDIDVDGAAAVSDTVVADQVDGARGRAAPAGDIDVDGLRP